MAGFFKALIHLLEARNILVGLLMLPHPPGFSSDPTEKEFPRFIGMEGKHPNSVWWLSPGVPPCSDTSPGCPGAEGCGMELRVVLQLRNWGTV